MNKEKIKEIGFLKKIYISAFDISKLNKILLSKKSANVFLILIILISTIFSLIGLNFKLKNNDIINKLEKNIPEFIIENGNLEVYQKDFAKNEKVRNTLIELKEKGILYINDDVFGYNVYKKESVSGISFTDDENEDREYNIKIYKDKIIVNQTEFKYKEVDEIDKVNKKMIIYSVSRFFRTGFQIILFIFLFIRLLFINYMLYLAAKVFILGMSIEMRIESNNRKIKMQKDFLKYMLTGVNIVNLGMFMIQSFYDLEYNSNLWLLSIIYLLYIKFGRRYIIEKKENSFN